MSATRAGETSHAFVLTAITEHVTAQERRADFHQIADQRDAQLIESAETLPWAAMRGMNWSSVGCRGGWRAILQ